VLVPELEAVFESLRAAMKNDALSNELTEFQAVAGDGGASLTPDLSGRQTREVTRMIGKHPVRFSAEGFFQINHALLEPLIAAAIDDALGETAIDLYCGAGLFTLPLAERFASVLGIEASAEAISFARRNLEEARLGNATFAVSTVAEWLAENSARLSP